MAVWGASAVVFPLTTDRQQLGPLVVHMSAAATLVRRCFPLALGLLRTPQSAYRFGPWRLGCGLSGGWPLGPARFGTSPVRGSGGGCMQAGFGPQRVCPGRHARCVLGMCVGVCAVCFFIARTCSAVLAVWSAHADRVFGFPLIPLD